MGLRPGRGSRRAMPLLNWYERLKLRIVSATVI